MAQERRGCLSVFFPRRSETAETVAHRASAEKLPGIYPYRPRKSVLSPAELVFYNVVRAATNSRYVILLKIRILDLCEITNREVNQAAFNRISSKHIDFVLCDPVSLAPVVAIELDDSSHYARDRAQRDHFVDEVFRTIGVALIRHRVQPAYDPDAIGRWIDAAIARSRLTPPSGAPLRPAS